MFLGLKQWIWEDPNGTTVSLGRFSYPSVQHYLLYEIRYLGKDSYYDLRTYVESYVE